MNFGLYPGFTPARSLAPGASYPEMKIRHTPLTAFTLTGGDVDTLIVTEAATTVTVTVPTALLTPGKAIHFQQDGAGQIVLSFATGVTPKVAGATKTRAQNSVISMLKRRDTPEIWAVFGDIASS